VAYSSRKQWKMDGNDTFGLQGDEARNAGPNAEPRRSPGRNRRFFIGRLKSRQVIDRSGGTELESCKNAGKWKRPMST
jgi:hypothetical protein